MMEILLLWLWYVLAFAAGVAVMMLVVTSAVKPRTEEEAIDHALRKEGSDSR